MSNNQTQGVRVELLVRSQAGVGAQERQQAVVETLEHLKQRAVIDDFAVRVCGSEVCMRMPSDDRLDGESIVSLVTQVQEWASGRAVSVEDVFREKTIASSFLDEEYTVVKLPYLSLLVFEAGELSAVYPCHEAGSFTPVEASLDALRARVASVPFDEVSVG